MMHSENKARPMIDSLYREWKDAPIKTLYYTLQSVAICGGALVGLGLLAKSAPGVSSRVAVLGMLAIMTIIYVRMAISAMRERSATRLLSHFHGGTIMAGLAGTMAFNAATLSPPLNTDRLRQDMAASPAYLKALVAALELEDRTLRDRAIREAADRYLKTEPVDSSDVAPGTNWFQVFDATAFGCFAASMVLMSAAAGRFLVRVLAEEPALLPAREQDRPTSDNPAT